MGFGDPRGLFRGLSQARVSKQKHHLLSELAGNGKLNLNATVDLRG